MSFTSVSVEGSADEENTEFDSELLMTTEEALQFQSYPMYRYVKEIGQVVSQNRQYLRSMEVKMDLMKKELDALRPGLQAFLEKMADAPEYSQSLLANSQAFVADERGKTVEPKPFVTVEWEGISRGLVLSPSVDYKVKGTDCARTRCRLVLEDLHPISDLRNMTVSGRKIEKVNGRMIHVKGQAVPELTLLYLYQMEMERRGIDSTKTHLMKTLRIEVKGYVSKILESFKSLRGEDGTTVNRSSAATAESNELDTNEAGVFN